MRVARLTLRIKASMLLATALLLAHGGAIACAAVFLPGWWMPALATTAVTASLAFHLRRDAWQLSGTAITGLILKEGAECDLILKNGVTFTGIIQGSTFVAPMLVVINVRAPVGRGRRSVILLPDSAATQDLRCARVWLRHRIRPDTPASRPL
jgi:hypothetical protein